MDLQFLMDLKELPKWSILKKEVLDLEFPFYQNHIRSRDSYQLIHVLVNEVGEPQKLRKNRDDAHSFVAFTEAQLACRIDKVFSKEEIQAGRFTPEPHNHLLKMMMLGEFIDSLKNEGLNTTVKLNPLFMEIGKGVEPLLYAEEVLFAPQYDDFTKKLLLTDPEDAKALLALNPKDQKRFGIELVFYMVSNRELPSEKEDREAFLHNKIEELAFMGPRVPLKKGSGSFLVVVLNLENELEERAFIRDYPMFDSYGDVIFVTSGLKMLTGRLEDIHYNGEKVDTIFSPLIKWQQSKLLRENLGRW